MHIEKEKMINIPFILARITITVGVPATNLTKNLKIAAAFRNSVPFQKVGGYLRAAYIAHFVLEPHQLHISRADFISLGGRCREGRYQTTGIRNSLHDAAN